MNRLQQALANPLNGVIYLTGRGRPLLLWRRLDRLARKAGLKRLYLILSFDCDRVEDAKPVLDLDLRLRDMGVRPVYAVPGALLEREGKIYEELFLRGSEFLNHGYEPHVFWNRHNQRYESTFFYDRLSLDQVRQDIRHGHASLKKVLGIRPTGFRTPHFGTFRTGDQLTFLHSFLKEMGYTYSSSTLPLYALRYGPVFNRFGLWEFPLSGMFSRPHLMQDSWGFYAAPDRLWEPGDFQAEAEALARFCREEGLVGILNYYADPSHVWDQPTFFKAVRAWKEIAEPVGFEALCPS